MRRILKCITKGIQIGITILLALLLVCNVYFIVMERVFGRKSPTIFGYSFAVIASGSMEPALMVDDLIINHAQSDYEKNDIITFHSGSSLTTHRIIEITDQGFVTKGDANDTVDLDVVPTNVVVGRVVWTIPHIGGVLAFLKSPFGMAILVFIGLCIIELPFFFQRRRDLADGEEL